MKNLLFAEGYHFPFPKRKKTKMRMVAPSSLLLLWILLYFSSSSSGVLAQSGSEDRFYRYQPTSTFESIQSEDYCELENDSKAVGTQCAHMNDKYTRFYFSVFIAIAWGGVVRTVIKIFDLSIPYTVVLLITGLVIGLGSRIERKFCEGWATFTMFARTPPELILYIFLPVLIFESAFNMKSHLFRSSFASICVIALPGMLLSTLFTAFFCIQFMPSYEWGLAQAGLFGAIISATDPVAVVAILRELGTSETLSIMIEGESLLNDGVAILLYEILKEIVEEPEGDTGSFQNVTIMFIRIAIGGPFFGWLMGRFAVWCLALIYNDAATELTITLVAAYLTYFVGEFFLHVSGVMAVVLLGVTMNAGSTAITPEIIHTVHLFWEMMSFLANTVLFILLGIVITETAINSFEPQDAVNLVILYVAINVIRLGMLFVMAPVLRRIGFDASWRNLTVMMWGGLRGAVGVCLALEVYRSKQICIFPKVGPKFLLHTAGIVILTLLLNGTTTKSLLDYLGVTALSSGKLQDMANAVKSLTAARVRTIISLKHDIFLGDADWEIVHRFTHLKDPYAKKKKDKTSKKEERKSRKTLKDVESGGVTAPQEGPSSPEDNKKKSITTPAPLTLEQKLVDKGLISRSKSGVEEDLSAFTTPSLLLLTTLAEGIEDEDEAALREEANLVPGTPAFKELMEECRKRVLKSIKISCWTQYEKGGLSEEAVKSLVSTIEKAEEKEMEMLHHAHVKHHWEIVGCTKWMRTKIILMSEDDALPDKPKGRWRHPFWWLTTRSWFHGFIYFVIFINLVPIIFELVYMVQGKSPKSNSPEGLFLFISTIVFTMIYLLEFILKIIGRGTNDYCSSKWNLLDFFVLIASLVDMGLSILAFGHDGASAGAVDISLLKAIRIVRFARLLRFARPLLPIANHIIEIKVNTRLFAGYDVGCGYVEALEDALRFLPVLIQNKIIYAKFRNLLDSDRLETIRQLSVLQMEHPGVVAAVKTRHTSRAICGYMKEELETMKEEGLLEEKEYDILIAEIDGNLKKLWAAPNKLKPPTVEIMIDSAPWAVGNHQLLDYFHETAEVRTYYEGEKLYSVGETPRGIYLLTSGLVKLHYDPTQDLLDAMTEKGQVPNSEFYLDTHFATTQEDYLGTGNVIGEYGFLTGLPRAAEILCVSDVEAVYWSRNVLLDGMKTFQDEFDSLEARLWRSWGIKMAAEYLHSTPQYASWSGDKIRAHLEQGVVPIGSHFHSMEIPSYVQEVILIYGSVVNESNGETIKAPALVPAVWTKIAPASPGAKVLVIARDEELEVMEEATSQTSLEKVILHGPGVTGLHEDEGDAVGHGSGSGHGHSIPKGRRSSIPPGASGGRRKSVGFGHSTGTRASMPASGGNKGKPH